MSRLKSHFRFRTLFAVLLGVVLVVGCGSGPSDPETLYQRALEFMKAGDYASARIELTNVLQAKPDHAGARWQLGQAYYAMGDAKAAIKEFDLAADLGTEEPGLLEASIRALTIAGENEEIVKRLSARSEELSATVRALLGLAYLRDGEMAAARTEIDRALAADENDLEALYASAFHAVSTGEAEAALGSARKAIALAPEALNPRWVEALALELRGMRAEALAAYVGILDLDPKYPRALLAAARLNLLEGDLDKAESYLADVAENAESHYVRAGILVKRGELRAARIELQEVLKVDPRHVQSSILLGMIDFETGETNQAIAHYRTAIASAPHFSRPRRLLAAIYVQENNYKAAIAVLNKGLGYHSTDPSYLSLLSGLLLKDGQGDRARQVLKNAVAAGAADDRADNEGLLGQLYMAMGEPDKGLAIFERQAEELEHSGPALHQILSYIGLNDLPNARKVAEALVSRFPKSAQSNWLLGDVYERMGLDADAKRSFERALETNPDYVPSLERLAQASLKTDPGAARPILERIVALGTAGRVAAEVNLARLDSAEGKPAQAQKRYEALISQFPNDARAYIEFAKILSERGDTKAGLAHLKKATEVAPTFAPIYPVYAVMLYKDKQFELAVDNAQKGLSAYPKHPQLLPLLARAQWAVGQTSEAIDTFKELTYLAPKHAGFRRELSALYRAHGDSLSARKELMEALALEPASRDGRIELARLEGSDGNFNAARTVLEKLVAEQPTNSALELLGDTLAALRQYDSAATQFLKVFQDKPTPTLAKKIFLSHMNAGKRESAFAVADQWIAEHPNDIEMLFTRGQVRLRKNEPDAAIADYQRVLAIDPNHVATLSNLAWLHGHRKDFDQAMRLGAKAYGLAPKSLLVADTYGWILANAGELEQARLIYQKFRLHDTAPPRLLYHLAVVEAKLGRIREASGILDAILRSERPFPDREAAVALRARL